MGLGCEGFTLPSEQGTRYLAIDVPQQNIDRWRFQEEVDGLQLSRKGSHMTYVALADLWEEKQAPSVGAAVND